MSTVDVSEYGLPVSRVSILASWLVRCRRRVAACWRMRDRVEAGVLDHIGNAVRAELMAASMAEGGDVWIVQMGVLVEGSIDWKVELVEVVGWGRPE